ncbi:hypothetical protein LTR53_008732 [Teratosphaeriaceae sp. CCFEE 6253]|nr:hypothetical protein LTR53_008732 [Teratosphaeriaceae sp. CCFEE 6253]
MKSFTAIAAITLVAAVTARPSSRLVARQDSTCILATQGNSATPQIAASINQWSADVNAFNDFLNQAYYLDPASLKSAASALLPNVEDESCQLGTLSGFLSGVSDAATCALGDLTNIYSTLEWTLNQIIADPTDNTNVQNSLEDINAYRCCNVLPDIDICGLTPLVWRASRDRSRLSLDAQTCARRLIALLTRGWTARSAPPRTTMGLGSKRAVGGLGRAFHSLAALTSVTVVIFMHSDRKGSWWLVILLALIAASTYRPFNGLTWIR